MFIIMMSFEKFELLNRKTKITSYLHKSKIKYSIKDSYFELYF